MSEEEIPIGEIEWVNQGAGMSLGRYRKLIVAIVGALGVIAAQIPTDAPSWVVPAISIATAFGVWLLRNDPAAPPEPPERGLIIK